jgi:hypothetical protein
MGPNVSRYLSNIIVTPILALFLTMSNKHVIRVGSKHEHLQGTRPHTISTP